MLKETRIGDLILKVNIEIQLRIMDGKLIGFLLGEGFHLDIANKRIMHYQAETPGMAMSLKVVTFNEAQLRLLLLLLTSKPGDVILKDDIMMNVFYEDGREVFSSSQKLWHLIKALRKKLSSVGLEENFISNAYGAGYFIDNRNNIYPIFI